MTVIAAPGASAADVAPARPPAARSSRRGRPDGLGLGALAAAAVFVVLPLGFLLFGAIRTGAPGQEGASFTLDHLQAVYASTKYLVPLRNTLVLAVLTTALAMPIGLVLAWMVARTDVRGRGFLEYLVITPMFLSPLLGTLAWVALAAPGSGFINAWLGRNLLSRDSDLIDIYSFWGIVFVMVLFYIPNVYLLNVGAFRQVDSSLEDAGRVVGASPRRVWFSLTAPMVLPSILSSTILIFILSAEQFVVPTLLGIKGDYETIPLLLYNGYSQGVMPLGEVAALATQLVVVAFVGLFVYRRVVRVSRRYVTITGKGSMQRRTVLGRWKIPLLVGMGVYILLAVVLPILALAVGSLQRYQTSRITAQIWTLDNYRRFFELDGLRGISNTVILGLGGGLLTVAFAFLIAYVCLRRRSVSTTLLDYVTSLSIAVPGIAMAVGLLWAYTTIPLPVYGTMALLVIAVIGRFVGQAVRLASASLTQVDPDLESAGRVSGMSRMQAVSRITFSVVRPSFVSAWIMVLILIVVEVATIIMLYTNESTTLSIVMWNSMSMTGVIAGFTAGIIQIAVVTLLLGLLYRLSKTRSPKKRRSIP
jgi:iron(III) transport system permease protein